MLGAMGGRVRAQRLAPERRAEIAKKASAARWVGHQKPIRATHTGDLKLGEIVVECAVLEDGRRVINDTAFQRALGRSRAGGQTYQRRSDGIDNLPIYLASKSLKPFIPEGFSVSTVPYIPRAGGLAVGVDARAIPKVCSIWLKARREGKLAKQQIPTAIKAEMINDALATVGIIALVDEATGYQRDRAADALAEILENYIAKELARWAKVFSDDYYRHLFRLRGLDFNAFSTHRPPLIGKLTANIVYARLAPGVLEELRRKNPKGENGSRKSKHHQWLTRDIGHPALREHLAVVEAFMKVAPSYEVFIDMLDRVAPRVGHTLMLPFENVDSGPLRLPPP